MKKTTPTGTVEQNMRKDLNMNNVKRDGDHVMINYFVEEDGTIISGMKLTGGYPTEIRGKKVVRFNEKIKGQPLSVMYENRPALAALVDEYNAIRKQIQAEDEERWANERAAQDAIDKPLLEKMERETSELRKRIPEGYVEVTVTKVGDSDGYPILRYTVDDTVIPWDQTEPVGTACAIRPGALGAFAEVRIASIRKEKLEKIRSDKIVENKREADKKAAREAERIRHEQEKQHRKDELMNGVISFDIRENTVKDEGGKTVEYKCTVLFETGERFTFQDRNVFDFGRVINPEYKIFDGQKSPGGLLILKDEKLLWHDFISTEGWKPIREITGKELQAYLLVEEFGPYSESKIRM